MLLFEKSADTPIKYNNVAVENCPNSRQAKLFNRNLVSPYVHDAGYLNWQGYILTRFSGTYFSLRLCSIDIRVYWSFKRLRKRINGLKNHPRLQTVSSLSGKQIGLILDSTTEGNSALEAIYREINSAYQYLDPIGMLKVTFES